MSASSFQELAQKIAALPKKYGQLVIGIDGGGGAGKSTFAEHLRQCLPNAVIIHIDDFYKGPWNARLDNLNYVVNPFFDWERFATEVIEPIREGKPIIYHIYDWHTHTTEKTESVPPDASIIIEGGYTTQQRFSDFYDFKIWIEAAESVRLNRALVRDGEHMRFLWEEDWLPVERNYIQQDNPKSRADLIVQGQMDSYESGFFELTHLS